MKPTLITSLALGSVLAIGSATLNAAENPFDAKTLKQGYQLAGDGHDHDKKDGEGKKGDGKCGEGKCGEGKCGEKKEKGEEKKDV